MKLLTDTSLSLLQFVKVFPSYTPNFIPKCLVVVFSVPLAIAGGFLVAALTSNPADYYEVCHSLSLSLTLFSTH
jgi:hypothetical protein